ncbi:MAG: helix-turn-helix domain-containing protein [Anaerolineales bacterium]
MPQPTEPDKSRHLSAAQEVAAACVLAGKTDGEVAEAVGVSRQTVWEWRHRHPVFIAEVNRRRVEVWEAASERLRGLVDRAVEVLEADLAGEDARLRQQAAVHVLRVVGLYGEVPRPTGPTTPEGVQQAEAETGAWARLWAPLLRPG